MFLSYPEYTCSICIKQLITMIFFQFVGEKLSHFMTLILVYMGNPDRMKNPHLRAELAETLAMLLPSDQTQNRALMSR